MQGEFGISTESGTPDFRGPQDIWKKMRPIELTEFLADSAARREYWRRKLASYPQMRDAEPNEGHRALTRFFQAGRLQSRRLSLRSSIPCGAF